MATQIWQDCHPGSVRDDWSRQLQLMQDQFQKGSFDALNKLELCESVARVSDFSELAKAQTVDCVNT